MPSDVIRNYLIRDTNDTTAAAIRAANPGMFSNDSDVPPYLYLSLKTLLVGASATTAEFERRIVSRLGEGKTVSEASIIIEPWISESTEHNEIDSDYPGAEYSDVCILFRNIRPVGTSQFNTLKYSELRIRQLLDNTLRNLSGKFDIPVTGDFCIDSNNQSIFKCIWRKFAKSDSQNNVSEFMAHYTVEYVRVFAKIPNLP